MADLSNRAFFLLFVLLSLLGSATAQTASEGESRDLLAMTPASERAALPDGPTSAIPARTLAVPAEAFAVPASDGGLSRPARAQAASSGPQGQLRTVHTGHFDNLIDPEEIAPKLSAGDKVGMGLKAAVSPFAVIGWIGSATYSEAFNRSPNYGQSAQDYAQRLGAAAARSSSQGIFSTSVMAPILHEDPRYFVEGPGHSGLHRTFYALSRVLITKTDNGRSTINYALLSGNAIGAGLTQTYYPAGNRNLSETVTTFGVSLAGSGVKYLLDEFFYKQASIAQLKKRF